MLVLIVILVPTINLKAESYVTKDSVIVGSQYYDFYRSKFGEDKSYQFFPYNCSAGSNNNRTCYYGIDKDNNYYKIYYNSSGDLSVEKGIDENFSVTGENIYKVNPSINYIILYALCFIFIFYIVYVMLGVVFI